MSIKQMVNAISGSSHQGRTNVARQMGPMIAVVTNNVDPEDRYRVKVKFPWLKNETESFWARIRQAGGGKEYGNFWLPEVDDEVLCIFQDGDIERPILIGGIWNGQDQSPRKIKYSPDHIEDDVPNNQQGGKNDFRFIRSRMDHHLMFKDREGEGAVSMRTKKTHELFLSDKDGEEKIQLYDMNQTQWLEIDVPNKKITMQTDTGSILIKAKDTIRMECTDLEVDASKTITVDSGTSSKWTAGSTLKWKSSQLSEYLSDQKIKIKAPRIDLNP